MVKREQRNIGRRSRVEIPDELRGKVGNVTDREMAELLGCNIKTARRKRCDLGISPKRCTHNWDHIVSEARAGVPVPTISERFGVSRKQIYRYLAEKGIRFTRLRQVVIPNASAVEIDRLKSLSGTSLERQSEIMGVPKSWIRKWRTQLNCCGK